MFDLDGTLVDSQNGIIKSIVFTLNKFKIYESDSKRLRSFVGPPLKESFVKYYDMKENTADDAVRVFREYYNKNGLYEVELYEGTRAMLDTLKSCGYRLFIATSKPTIFAQKIAKYLRVDSYFEEIAGSNLDNTRSKKAEIIEYLIDTFHMGNKKEILMIGDKSQDILGAAKCDISAIGVSYGYGTESELQQSHPIYIADSPEKLTKYIRNAEYE